MEWQNNTFGNVPVFSWCASIEDGALEQIKNLAAHPRVYHHIAIMPDCHQGYGMPIGGVAAFENSIIPNAVGVDIGCGMCAVKTSVTEWNEKDLRSLCSSIRSLIPTGFTHHKKEQSADYMPSIDIDERTMPVVSREYESALHQLGTLGGGNHFIELQRDAEHHLWIMIHSGSRNLGKQVADHYNRAAREFNEKNHSALPKGWQLDFLPDSSREGIRYLQEMEYCVEFALCNRALMMERIKEILSEYFPAIQYESTINIAHNYAALETHFGKKVWVHRKGATLASQGTIGIIPGSQGTKSYIVRGKGNSNSFQSCSHGAGRLMGRKEAERRLDLNDERKKLETQGIIHALRSKHDLEEASGAYKDIDMVMRAQTELVEIVTELSPCAVIKG